MPYNSDHFDLTTWKLTLPESSNSSKHGKALEIKNLQQYENSKYFYDASDGAMVFKANADSATTVNSKYARAELRELDHGKDAFWSLKDGGTMTATLKVDALPTYKDGSDGRIIVGQIHGKSDELIRLYYENNTVYFKNDHAGANNKEMRFDLTNAQGKHPDIALGEKFSYEITVSDGDHLTVKVISDGQTFVSESTINKSWHNDAFYFKAGLYMGVNEANGKGEGQVSFYGLDISHEAGHGHGGWGKGSVSGVDHTPPIPTPPIVDLSSNVTNDNDVIRGNNTSETLKGHAGDDTVKGGGGNDLVYGGNGNDELWGNNGNDTLVGGLGHDTIKGGDGKDTYLYQQLADGQDDILDFRNGEKVDIAALHASFTGEGATMNITQLLALGYVTLDKHIANQVTVSIDLDGTQGASHAVELVTLHIEGKMMINGDIFIV